MSDRNREPEQLDLLPPEPQPPSWRDLPPAQVLAALQRARAILLASRLYPRDLYAYALALDARDVRDELNSDTAADDPGVALAPFSWRDALAQQCEIDLDDGRDEVMDTYAVAEALIEALHPDEVDHV